MLDGGADARAAGIAAADVGRHRPALGLAVVDLAAEAVPLHEGLVGGGAIGAVGPDRRAGVGGVEQPAPQHPAVVPAGVGHVPSADEAVPAVDAGMALVAEDRYRDVGVLRAVLAQARLAEHQRPAPVAVLLTQLCRLGFPILRDPALLDRFLLLAGVALF